MRYPGPDGKLNTRDDLVIVDDLHFVKNKTALIYLKSSDVLHSFFLPQLRIKQDAVPGLTIPVWFDADRSGKYELVCAELCGWGHYKMRGNVVVHDTDEQMQNGSTRDWPSRTGASSPWRPAPRGGDWDECGAYCQRSVGRGPPAPRPSTTATGRRTITGTGTTIISTRRPGSSSPSTSSRPTTRSSASSSCSRG